MSQPLTSTKRHDVSLFKKESSLILDRHSNDYDTIASTFVHVHVFNCIVVCSVQEINKMHPVRINEFYYWIQIYIASYTKWTI